MSAKEFPTYVYSLEKKEISGQDFFLQYEHITELNLATYQNYFIPLSISQCQLIERVDLSDTTFSQPPAILFTLPQIRAHPEKIFLGDKQVCTRQLMIDILAECKYYQSFTMKFRKPQQEEKQYSVVSFSPETTVLDFMLLTHPELGIYLQYFALVRTIQHKSQTLRIFLLPDDMPLVLYQYPNATWSVELISTPSYDLPQELEPYVDFYIHRINAIRVEPLTKTPRTEQSSYLNYIPTFKIKLQLNNAVKDGVITVQPSTISVSVGSSAYFVFENRNVHLAFLDSKYVIFLGKKALVLDKSCIRQLLPLFQYTVHPFFLPRNAQAEDDTRRTELNITTDLFAEIATRAQLLSMSVKLHSDQKRALHDWQKDNIEVLKSIKSTSLPFTRKLKNNARPRAMTVKKLFTLLD